MKYRVRFHRPGARPPGKFGRHVLLADLRRENADAAAKTLREAGFDASTATVDIASRAFIDALVGQAASTGPVMGLIQAAGVSPIVVASQSGHHLSALTAGQDRALTLIPADELLALPMLQPDQVTDPLHAY